MGRLPVARGQKNGADVKISALRACQYEIFYFVPKIGVSLVCGENRSLSFAVSELRPGFPVLVEAFPELIELIACDLPAERPDDVAFALPLVFYLGLFKAVLRVEVCAADSFTGVVSVVVGGVEGGGEWRGGQESALSALSSGASISAIMRFPGKRPRVSSIACEP